MVTVRLNEPTSGLASDMQGFFAYASFDSTDILRLCTASEVSNIPGMTKQRVAQLKVWLEDYGLSLKGRREPLLVAAHNVYHDTNAVPLALMGVRVAGRFQEDIRGLVRHLNYSKRTKLQNPDTYVNYGDIQRLGLGFLRRNGCSDELIHQIELQLHELDLIATN